VFARAQNALRERQDVLSTYVDVKSPYDIVDAHDIPAQATDDIDVDQGIYRAHMLRKAFLGTVLAELLKEIDDLCEAMSLWDRWLGKRRSFTELRGQLTAIQTRVKNATLQDQELPILQQITRRWKSRQQEESSTTNAVQADAEASLTSARAGVQASVSDFDRSLDDNEIYNEYSDIVLRSFPFDESLGEIRDLLFESGMKRLIVFFDDFSELRFVDQRLFVDVVLAPLNNASNESVKLKIAGYPGRVYYGRIDSTKVDTISLDFSALYEDAEVQSMERSAINYATRLVTTRFSAFGENVADYFDAQTPLDQHMR
jgi:hypothetical protein